MKKTLDKIKATPWVAHVMRAVIRYGNRLGAQFAGAATYFSVLAIVPVLMLTFAGLGMTLTWLRPELMDQLKDMVIRRFGADSSMGEKVGAVIDDALHNWPGIGIFGLVSFAYAGAGWVSNLKTAVRAQWRPEFDKSERKRNIALELLVNLGHLVVILGLVGLVVSAAQASSSLNGVVVQLLHLEHVPGIGVLAWLMGFAAAMLAGVLLFAYVYRFMPEPGKPRWKPLVIGSLWAAVGIYVLQALAGIFVGMFAKNRAAVMFGPVIVIMLFINLFMQLALFIAAWIATENQPAVAGVYNECDEPLRERGDDASLADGHWAAADHDKMLRDRGEAADPAFSKANANLAWARQQQRRAVLGPDPEHVDRRVMVPQSVAVKGVQAGIRGGWLTGVATGLGVGAVIARLLTRR